MKNSTFFLRVIISLSFFIKFCVFSFYFVYTSRNTIATSTKGYPIRWDIFWDFLAQLIKSRYIKCHVYIITIDENTEMLVILTIHLTREKNRSDRKNGSSKLLFYYGSIFLNERWYFFKYV